MALSFEAIVGSDADVSADGTRIVRKFRGTDKLPVAGGSDYFDTVASAAWAWAKGSYPAYSGPNGTLYLQNVQLHERFYGQYYDISVTWGKEKKETGTYQLTYNGTGGTVHVTAGTRVAGYAKNPDDIENNRGLIGKDGDEVKGIDIPSPQTRLTVSYRHPEAFLNRAYLKAITELTGYHNSDTFLGYAPGEVRFSGPDATESDSEASAQYSFEISRNRVNFVVAGITIASKKGWEVLSPVYREAEDGGHGIREVKCIEVVKDAGGIGEKAFVAAFGWGG